jgi:16S rRNA (guanine966-N2)-methyltransferase
MRIVSGALKGRRIVTPPGEATRPTSDRARQAVFNILEHAPWSDGLGGARVIDLFAGSGAMGLEALSRGAAACAFVESDRAACDAIQANIAAMGQQGVGRLLRRDAAALGPCAEEPFDLAFLDPPYAKGLGEKALAALAAGGWLQPGALVVLERGAAEPPIRPEGYEVLDVRRYGAASVSFMRSLSPRPEAGGS